VRPILVGIALFFVGMIGWVVFKILSNIKIGIVYFDFEYLTLMFQFIAILSIPIALAFEILLAVTKKE